MAAFDTNIIIDLAREIRRRVTGPASRRFEQCLIAGEPRRTTVFTIAELRLGIAKAKDPRFERESIERILEQFEILHFREATADIYATIVAELQRGGFSIAAMDALIASVVIEHDELLLTRNPRHFDRIRTLRIERL